MGYFLASESALNLGVYEAVVAERDLLPSLLDAIEWYARGRWIALAHTTLTRDARGLLQKRGFSLAPNCHAVLMARSLPDFSPDRIAALRRLVRHPRFSFHRGDMF